MFRRKTGRVITRCLNCGLEFSLARAEYNKRINETHLGGLFHSTPCLLAYRKTHKQEAIGLKNRILKINQRGKL